MRLSWKVLGEQQRTGRTEFSNREMRVDSSLGGPLVKDNFLIVTGAGVSTASGIPDFRGPNGVWTRRRPVYYDDFRGVERRADRRTGISSRKRGDSINMRDRTPFTRPSSTWNAQEIRAVVTQNVDGLHRRAGTSLDVLVEMHGTDLRRRMPALPRDERPCASFRGGSKRPCCSWGCACAAASSSLPRSASANRSVRPISNGPPRRRLRLIGGALGSTLSVYPAASIPLIAAERGVPYVIVNRGDTEHDGYAGVTLRLDGDLTAIVAPAVEAALAIAKRASPAEEEESGQ